MGLKDKMLSKSKEITDKREAFTPLDLNEGDVQAIFNRCRKPDGDGSADFDTEALKKNRANIRYLLGQLALVHEGVKEHELDAAFCKRYDGEVWTTDSDVLIDLLNMGGHSDFCAFYKQDEKQFVELKLDEIKPTLSPKDAGFAAWWDSPDVLLTRAKLAGEQDNKEEALRLYQKAAEQGNAEAQYRMGYCYAFGLGAEKDLQEAVKWLQQAEKRGHEYAAIFVNALCKKGLFGNKIIDPEEAISHMADHWESLSPMEQYFVTHNLDDLSEALVSKIGAAIHSSFVNALR